MSTRTEEPAVHLKNDNGKLKMTFAEFRTSNVMELVG
jgi:hypothetical protein